MFNMVRGHLFIYVIISFGIISESTCLRNVGFVKSNKNLECIIFSRVWKSSSKGLCVFPQQCLLLMKISRWSQYKYFESEMALNSTCEFGEQKKLGTLREAISLDLQVCGVLLQHSIRETNSSDVQVWSTSSTILLRYSFTITQSGTIISARIICCPISSVINPISNKTLHDDMEETVEHSHKIQRRKRLIRKQPRKSSKDDMNAELLNHPSIEYLPIKECGTITNILEPSTEGRNATPGQFPWVARIGFRLGPQDQYLCSGALVSHRYIVTSARCVSRLPSSLINLNDILLGEVTSSTNPDCTSDDGSRCADSVQNLRIEKVIPHPGYSNRDNDIALVRLHRDVTFSDWIRPICLPIDQPKIRRDVLVTAGWRRTGFLSREGVDTMIYSQLHKLPDVNCTDTYYDEIFGPHNVCIGADGNTSTCSIDAGGPLMMWRGGIPPEGRAYLVAVANFGQVVCGRTKIPTVYTDIYPYLRWMLDSIQQ